MKLKKFWNWTKNDASRTLFLNGVISEETWYGDEITPKLFKDELHHGTDDIIVWINSPGGDCIAASQIYNMLMDYKGNVIVKIDGIAASAASVIAMAGTEVHISPTGLMMIHNPLTVAFGDVNEMEKASAMLSEVKESIITAFEEANPDPRVISKQEGFRNHKEMAEYMTVKGYEWNAYKDNYIKTVGKVEETIDEEIESAGPELRNPPTDIDEYIPFLRFLYEKRDDIYQLISGTKEDGKLPRYVVPGLVRTKAIYMSDMVAKLAAEFSKEKNVTQRDVMEGALIEYLQKYGFKREIETLLKNE